MSLQQSASDHGMASLLKGVGFITGAASGIGKATAHSFAQHGVSCLAITDINLEAARKAAAEIEAHFSEEGITVKALPLAIDVTDEQSVNDAVAETVKHFGRIDYAVNCAGIGGPSTLSAEHEVSGWKKTVDIDLTGVWLSSRAEIRQMLKQEPQVANSKRHNRGVIVNVASMYGIVGTSLNVPVISYVASKHGVVGLTKADAIAYAPQNIRINAICPGYVATPLLQGAMESGVMKTEVEKTPMQRMADMDEMADHITFLVSPMSSFMCGTAMVADGGFTIQ